MTGREGVKKLASALAILAVLAMIDSAYLLFLHYSPSSSAFCDISPSLSCGIVNKSAYSELAGVPLAILGFLTFLVIFLLSVSVASGRLHANRLKGQARAILLLLGASAIFSIYLIYVQAVLLLSFCILCLLLDAIILISLIIAIILNKKIQ
ncbi:MAG TPA: vitamin K epoxide reductase family protein [Nanoarchaeota archaeon]|nr:MAG: vitamin K epoxide reductase [archaeon GW2011_AR6]MBS3082901.1 hypothetical protein [Candidatus Pacearchaeota archaeon]HIH18118.1 vitamin K epoxide reductase family protein [Nanoarchaeota archaeon]HIH34486.1 vitamin K epoxide reductase family protein [Nanoarchaeota archaeon]HIH51567.1 vitamin K epoxide reductase family protein [Nanoarchaeota archaeon]